MIKVIAFDAFGTLFNLNLSGISNQESNIVEKVLSYARQKQLEYTWLYSLMGQYLPFDKLTLQVLRHACDMLGGDENLADKLSDLYLHPTCYDDVVPELKRLSSLSIKRGILSNGTLTMLKSGIEKNELAPYLDFCLSADDVQVFKPSPSVYNLVLQHHIMTNPREVLFVSSNQWDVAGASQFGFQCCWLNRDNKEKESLLNNIQFQELASLKELLPSSKFFLDQS